MRTDPELLRDTAQPIDHVLDVLAPLQTDELDAVRDLFPADTGGESPVLQLLHYGLGLEVVDAVRAHQTAGEHDTGELIARDQDLVQLTLRLDASKVGAMRKDGLKYDLRVSELAQVIDGGDRVVVGEFLPVQVV